MIQHISIPKALATEDDLDFYFYEKKEFNTSKNWEESCG